MKNAERFGNRKLLGTRSKEDRLFCSEWTNNVRKEKKGDWSRFKAINSLSNWKSRNNCNEWQAWLLVKLWKWTRKREHYRKKLTLTCMKSRNTIEDIANSKLKTRKKRRKGLSPWRWIESTNLTSILKIFGYKESKNKSSEKKKKISRMKRGDAFSLRKD